jgi:hypothetical protein
LTGLLETGQLAPEKNGQPTPWVGVKASFQISYLNEHLIEKTIDCQLAKWITFLSKQISCLHVKTVNREKEITPGKKSYWRVTKNVCVL